jgi:hypothetical protein
MKCRAIPEMYRAIRFGLLAIAAAVRFDGFSDLANDDTYPAAPTGETA